MAETLRTIGYLRVSTAEQDLEEKQSRRLNICFMEMRAATQVMTAITSDHDCGRYERTQKSQDKKAIVIHIEPLVIETVRSLFPVWTIVVQPNLRLSLSSNSIYKL
jgi:hypothetical protein